MRKPRFTRKDLVRTEQIFIHTPKLPSNFVLKLRCFPHVGAMQGSGDSNIMSQRSPGTDRHVLHVEEWLARLARDKADVFNNEGPRAAIS